VSASIISSEVSITWNFTDEEPQLRTRTFIFQLQTRVTAEDESDRQLNFGVSSGKRSSRLRSLSYEKKPFPTLAPVLTGTHQLPD